MIPSSRQCRILVWIFLPRRLNHLSSSIIFKKALPAVAYQPSDVEAGKYEKWEKTGIFNAKHDHKEPYTIILPPPNITGKLHLGHALTSTIQDVIARRKRSLGYNVLWIPGIDHAGIATQTVVEKFLKSTRNIDRRCLSREQFNLQVWKWTEKYGNTIGNQLRALGCSLDWNRECFTMNPNYQHAVNNAFITLFDKGLIYRKKSLVNWCTALKSTISDIEVEEREIDKPTAITVPGYEEQVTFGILYKIAYKIFDSNEEIVVATTMPETMLGDVAIAIHPDDVRYHKLKGKKAIHPITKLALPIICDDFVKSDFGTGAVKITPAHSKVDYEVALTHKLPMLQVIGEDGRICNSPFTFNGATRYECRKKILSKLDTLGLIRAMMPHKMTLPMCSRTGDIVNYIPKEQWYLACSDINKRVSKLFKAGNLVISPGKYEKNWTNWTDDSRDWCISRQLWWGHQIPAYKCSTVSKGQTVWVAADDEESAKIKASKHLKALAKDIKAERDTDVLDTWFSSGIYPFAALGWPNMERKNQQFYPLSLMVTGHDILGFWVHRMAILGLELTGQLPFKEVLLHGIICDHRGGKMSKSKGNVIDPIDVVKGISLDKLGDKSLDMFKQGMLSKEEFKKALNYQKSNFSDSNGIPQCGVDALRFTLLSSDIKSNFINFDVHMCHANKLFCNKIWQSVKYTIMSFAKLKNTEEEITLADLTHFDRWILSRLAALVDTVNLSIDSYDFHKATKALRSIIYNDFCDVYLEATKLGFLGKDMKLGYAHAHTLSAFLNTSLRCLNPFMVYLTDVLIPRIPEFSSNIIYNYNDSLKDCYDFPQYYDFVSWRNCNLEKQVERLLDAATLVRGLKGLYKIPNQYRPSIRVISKDAKLVSDLQQHMPVFLNLTRCCCIDFDDEKNLNYVKGYLDKDTEIGIEYLGDDVSNTVLHAKDRLKNRIKKLEEILYRLQEKLADEVYIRQVPDYARAQEKEKFLTKQKELELLQRLIDKETKYESTLK